MRISRLLAALALVIATAARAGTVEVSSTTLLNVAPQTRGGLPNQKPDVITTAPAFELLSLTARDLRNPVADDLSIVLSTWGSVDIADRRWDNGTSGNLTGDVQTGYISGRLFKRALTLRLGRQVVQAGAARMLHIDGAEAVAQSPYGLRLSGYVGAPVAERFASRTGVRSWNPTGGDLAYGGRLSYSLALAGAPGRGLDLGASVNRVTDGGDVVREEAAVDLRLAPLSKLWLSGLLAYSLYDELVSEATLRGDYDVNRRLHVNADYQYVRPDLLLSRNSILSVFVADDRHAGGAGASYDVTRSVSVAASYHLLFEPAKEAGGARELGHEGEARVEYRRGDTTGGVEGSVVESVDNGYVGERIYGRQAFGPYFAAADVLAYEFKNAINDGKKLALTGTLTAGRDLVKGLSAVVSARAGVTPFLEQTFEVMAKLVYNQTYRKTEVR